MKFIRDSVHGDLQLGEFEVSLADTPEIQRLRRIKQLGFTYLVYPGANHSRFEHSIGTMYLASRLSRNLQLDEHTQTLVRSCALLHDAGHGPFSHVSEGVINSSHEELTSKLIKESQLGDILSEKFSIKEIIKVISGKGPLGQIISGELDVDRMDYLLRDSHYTGVAYGVIDVERLIFNMKLDDGLILQSKGVQAAESMLLARYFMYPSVYQHHTTRIVNSMFRRCLKKLLEKKVINASEIYKYDDTDVISAARSQKGYIKDIITRIDTRKLYKRVYSLKLDETTNPESVFQMSLEKINKIEEEIANEVGAHPDCILVDIPEYPAFHEMTTPISLNGDTVKLGEVSNLVMALKDARFNHADLSIYLPEEYAEHAFKLNFPDFLDITD
ncbi:HD domain-containing protein [Methanobacterium petrolearium]|uniref:HD domain-containing protein n=1 Tax=Methanobacterium petrolearium TaxID=710190 RepID=UPI001AE63B4C|nr:HD domain-containing protein [Methanobacterium petrolearium]MBP1945355.1 HD superfamily phosphohydrolase [Methanobacterium petrolearium]BDZ71544.1 phosphodiesterase [Methanobacterium petrolearium]